MTELIEPIREYLSKLRWDRGRLTATDDELRNGVKRDYLSVSTAQAMEGCIASWFASRTMPAEIDVLAPNEIGTGGHSVLENLWNLPPDQRTTNAAAAIVEQVARDTVPDNQELRETFAAAVEESIGKYLEMEDPQKLTVHSTELEIRDIEIEGVPFLGFVDRISETDEGLSADDVKTSAKLPQLRYGDKHGDQIRIYGVAIEKKLGEKPVRGSLLYTRLGHIQEVSLSKKSIDKTLQAWRASWQVYQTQQKQQAFDTKVSALCGWCPLVNLCPSAIKAGKTDRKGGALDPDLVGIIAGESLPFHYLSSIPSKKKPQQAPAVYDPYDEDETDVQTAPSLDTSPVTQDSALLKTDTPSTTQEVSNMTKSDKFTGAKPWDETVYKQLNPNSYSAQAVLGLVQMAYKTLEACSIAITKSNVDALAHTYALIVHKIQESLTEGETPWMDNSNARARGILWTVIESNPLPFGSEVDDLDKWFAAVTKRGQSIAKAGIRLYETFDPDSDEALYQQFSNQTTR